MSEEGLSQTVVSVDQADLESHFIDKAKKEIADEENRLDEQRLEKTKKKIKEIEAVLAKLHRKIGNARVHVDEQESVRSRITTLEEGELAQLKQDIRDIRGRIRDRADVDDVDDTEEVIPNLVRLGKITPFAKSGDLQEDEVEERTNHQNLMLPDNEDSEDAGIDADKKTRDDGSLIEFNYRVQKWQEYRQKIESEPGYVGLKDCFIDAQANFKIPGDIWKNLFGYQRTGVRWLWELYCQKVGGIIGDEMGLGKTVQVVSFIAALQHSQLLKRPALILCPATVLEQWVQEFHHWWPPLRVSILHSTGTAFTPSTNPTRTNNSDYEDEESNEEGEAAANAETAEQETEEEEEEEDTEGTVNEQNARKLVKSVFETGHVLITTYAGIKRYKRLLLPQKWGYCCLDEGHSIRNPDSEVSITCKQVLTPYRLILSGTPIQNRLVELWSLFDFVYPGRLGTLPVFVREFDVPIQIGGYAKATNIQVQTAYKCAVILKNMIAPYMLRRMKCDVAADLPKKTEKVLFCKFTKEQKRKYQEFVTYELERYTEGKRNLLAGIDTVRKICNHPDLVVQDTKKKNYGDPEKSGKMQVLRGLLELWKQQGHKALLFSQSRQMLDILDNFVSNLDEFNYLRMDGTTPISKRQQLIDKFNKNPVYDLFLLTTRVGGLGVNLTGANRVIIFDPDWNPSNDVQARERAWRLGQKKEVLIYRLIMAGSIEERIYERQIYKQYLSNKILKDPKQKRFFKNSDLYELLSLKPESDTADMYDTSSNRKLEKSSSSSSSPDPKRRKKQEQDDLSQFMGVSKETNYGGDSDDDDDENSEKSKASKQEGDLLKDIFSKAGVTSTSEQDAVNTMSRPDALFMEREAERIASQAAETLQMSRKQAQKHEIGTPTWTGKVGIAGKKLKTSNASVKLLDSLRKKKELETKARDTRQLAPTVLTKNADILGRIKQYLETQPGNEAKTPDIIANCNISVNGTQEVLNLRHLLRKIAEFSDKKWKLKEVGNEAV